MCHPPDWATCPLLVFFHVARDHAVRRLDTSEEKDVTVGIGSRNPEESKRFTDIDLYGLSTSGESTPEESEGEEFETPEAQRAEAIHNR
jgi:hypothetical protein